MFDPESDDQKKPVLEVVRGQKIQVVATQGVDAQPFSMQTVQLRSVYEYSWSEDGRTRHGNSGRNWSVTTDANGHATTFATPGKLKASIYTSDWHTEQTVDVTEGMTTNVKLHRPVAQAAPLKGVLTGADASELRHAQVTMVALDGETSGQKSVQADENGNFELKVKSAKVGLLAFTESGKFSATSIIEVPPVEPINLVLQPTIEYKGQLLGDNDQPMANTIVRAIFKMDPDSKSEFRSPQRLEGIAVETTTDDEGRYALAGIPLGIQFELVYQPADKSSASARIGDRYATTGEIRPVDILRTVREPAKQPEFNEQIQQRLGDCRRYGINSLVIVLSNETSTDWANEIISDYDNNRAILGYLPILINTLNLDGQEDKKKFLAKYRLKVPEPNHVAFCVLNGDGESLAAIDLDCTDSASTESANAFIADHEPPANDAQQKLNAALMLAGKTGRVVWVQHSQTRCGPCYRLSRWIDEHRTVLEKQFVFVKIDDVRDENGIEISKRVTRDRNFGIPFVAIMNPDGEVMIDGEGPLGNIGFPTGFESSQHLRTMITSTGTQITDSELDSLLDSLIDSK